jgi:hypothetical protein
MKPPDDGGAAGAGAAVTAGFVTFCQSNHASHGGTSND